MPGQVKSLMILYDRELETFEERRTELAKPLLRFSRPKARTRGFTIRAMSAQSEAVKSLIVCLKYGPGTTRIEQLDRSDDQDEASEDSRYTGSAATESLYGDDTDAEITSDSLPAPMYRVSRRLRLRFLGSTTSDTVRPIRALSPPNPSFRSADKIIKATPKRRLQTAVSQREFYTARTALIEKRAPTLALFDRITHCLSQDLSGSGEITVSVSPGHFASCWDIMLLMPDMLQVSASRPSWDLSNGEGNDATLETPDSLNDILGEAPLEQVAEPEGSAPASQQWTGLAATDDNQDIPFNTCLLADVWLGFGEEGPQGEIVEI